MARTPRRYAVHLHLSGGQSEIAHFKTLEAFQQWYGGVLTAAPSPSPASPSLAADTFVNVPMGDLEGEYLVVRPSAVIGIRVEPLYGSLDE
jgi:hypothetical protein